MIDWRQPTPDATEVVIFQRLTLNVIQLSPSLTDSVAHQRM